MEQIITNLLDTDKYKITMMQERYFHKNGNRLVRWKVNIRTNSPVIDKYYDKVITELKNQVNIMNNMSFSNNDIEYLTSSYFHKTNIMKDEFLKFLKLFRLKSKSVIFEDNGDIFVQDTWVNSTLWETYILSMVNEILTFYYSKDNYIDIYKNNIYNINKKISYLYSCDFPLIEFGTRRRASKLIQTINVNILSQYENFIGTSNMLLSKTFNLKCIGTMAHELFMGEAAFAYVDGNDVRESHKNMMIRWNDFYNGELNIFLSDTFGTDAFLKDFEELGYYKDSKNGIRQDSGIPLEFCKKIENFYTKLNVPFEDKQIVYSDGLNLESSNIIHNSNDNNLLNSFGIGTSITNDCGGFPISVVCKLAYVFDEKNNKWVSTVKLSDNANKATGEPEMVKEYMKIFNYTNNEENNTELIY